MVRTDIKYSSADISAMEEELKKAHEMLVKGTGRGNEFTGWVDLPVKPDADEIDRIKAAAKKIQDSAQVLIVIGIGGSYLGARAALELLKGANYNLKKKATPDVFFAGNGLDSDYIRSIFELVGDRDFAVNVISKSGTTTEPAVAFRFFKELLEKKYGKAEAKDRIFVTTDKAKGKLRELSDKEGYETFVIPDDIGGRFSVLTPVGLLPLAAAGVDIDALLAGAAAQRRELMTESMENPAWQYAGARNAMLRAGKSTEILGCYKPDFRFFAEWWKQLYGESEGKEGKGLFPASVEFTADLHSMGQYIQDGQRVMFETIVNFEPKSEKLMLPTAETDFDALKYLEGKDVDFIAQQAFKGVVAAHVSGNVPNIALYAGKLNEENVGALIYFFEFACAISGYLLGVNPFDQPGVEQYKKNMFALLGKPGYEELRKELLNS